MLVKHVMTAEVRSCPPDATLAGAARIMSARECGAVPVVDAEHKLIGILTDRDVCLAVAGHVRSPQELPVKDAMTRTVYTCSPDDDTASALRVMRHFLVRRLPVVSTAGRVVGLLSIDDIMARVSSAPDAEITSGEVIETLKALSAHVVSA